MWVLFLLSAMGFAIATIILIYIGHKIYLAMVKNEKEQELKLKKLNEKLKKEDIKGEDE
ncbi:UNVERIFIED_CONTAM: hypothetical protein MUK63_06130 [Blautia caecimuris]